MKNPFLAVGRNQMIWDHDLNPEGLAAQYSRKFEQRSFSPTPRGSGSPNGPRERITSSSAGRRA